jgi:hypothetical protein
MYVLAIATPVVADNIVADGNWDFLTNNDRIGNLFVPAFVGILDAFNELFVSDAESNWNNFIAAAKKCKSLLAKRPLLEEADDDEFDDEFFMKADKERPEFLRWSQWLCSGKPSMIRARDVEKCECQPKEGQTGCGHNCLNRHLFTTCDKRVCPCGDSCSNRPFHLLDTPRMKLIDTSDRGRGLFLSEPLLLANTLRRT